MIKKFLLSFCLLISFISAKEPIANAYTEVPKEDFVCIGSAKLFYRALGKGNPLIVLHGGAGVLSQDYLLPQLYKLAENNLVIFYDQRGCGASTGDINADTINIETFVQDLDAIRQTLHFQKISILGHSWGGFLAMQYALTYPESVEKLILSNSMPAASEEYALFMQEYTRRTAPYQKELEAIQHTKEFAEGNSEIMEKMYRMLLRTYCYNPEKVQLLNLYIPPSASLRGAQVYEYFRRSIFIKSFNLYGALQRLKIPTLIIHGDTDPIPLIAAQKIHENIKDSKYVVLTDCGHFPYVEQPDAWFNHTQIFLTTKS